MKEYKRLMLTGAHGFVGARVLERHPEAIVVPSALVREGGEGLAEFVRAHQPDVIVNAAAISDIGICERNPDASYAANVTLPLTLAGVSREVGAKLLNFSSDQVYTGCTDPGPYREDEPLPTPANTYARHKLEAEARVLDLDPDAVLLRATWMYDMPRYDHANRGNFLVNTIGSLMRGETMAFSSREYRGITYVRQVVELLDQMMTLPGGVYNYGSENPLNMVETAAALLQALGLGDRVDALVAENRRERHNLWMDCAKLKRNGVRFDTTAEGFARCVGDYRLSFGG